MQFIYTKAGTVDIGSMCGYLLLVALLSIVNVACYMSFPDDIEGEVTLVDVLFAPFCDEPKTITPSLWFPLA